MYFVIEYYMQVIYLIIGTYTSITVVACCTVLLYYTTYYAHTVCKILHSENSIKFKLLLLRIVHYLTFRSHNGA